MYTENPIRDVLLFGKAVLSNQIARVSPALYVRLTNERMLDQLRIHHYRKEASHEPWLVYEEFPRDNFRAQDQHKKLNSEDNQTPTDVQVRPLPT